MRGCLIVAVVLCACLLAACQGYVPAGQPSGAAASAGAPNEAAAIQALVLEINLEPDQLIGAYKAGSGCYGQRLLRWSDGSPAARAKAGMLKLSNAALADAGYRVTSFHEDAIDTAGQTPPDYGIGAVVTMIDLDLCRDQAGQVTGSGTVSVDWLLMAIGREEVLFWKTTKGHAAVGAPAGGAGGATGSGSAAGELEAAVIAAAVADAARQLAAAPELMALAPRSGKRAAAPVASKPPPAPLTLPQLAPLTGRFSANSPRIQQAVVVVEVGKGEFGSGFYITADGYLLTNQHVTGGAKTLRIVEADGRTFHGAVLREDEARDVALIKVERRDAVPLPLLRRQALVGEEVYAIGAPLDQALTGTVTKGIVSALRRYDGETFIQADADIQPGNSGGPLTDESGNVIGIAVSLMGAGSSIGLNFFIPIDEALAALGITMK